MEVPFEEGAGGGVVEEDVVYEEDAALLLAFERGIDAEFDVSQDQCTMLQKHFLVFFCVFPARVQIAQVFFGYFLLMQFTNERV